MRKEGHDKGKTTRAVVGYFDSNGNFIPVSSDNPIPIGGDVNVVGGGGGGIPLVLGWDDVQTFKDIEHPEQIEVVDEQKAFDKNIFTYAQFIFHPNGEYSILLRKPCNISGMTIFGVPPSEIIKLTYYITYVDGTRDIGNPQQITDTGGYIPINPLKKCLAINLKNDTLNDISVNIFEFLIYTVLQVVMTGTDIQIGAIEIKDKDTDNRAIVDADGNLYTKISNSPLAYDSINDLFKISLDRDNTGLAKDSTLQQALPRNLTEVSGVALTGRDWSGDFAKLQEIELYLSDLDPSKDDYIQLKHAGSFTAGTYTQSYTPANGEIVYIDVMSLNSYTGRAELLIDFGGDVLGRISVDAVYYEMNAQQYIKQKVVGDGTKALTLTLYTYSNGEYFGAVRMWKVRR